MRGEERAHGVGVEFFSVVRLESNEGEMELGVYIGMERTNERQHLRFQVNWKCPSIMSVIIKQHKIVFET